MRQPLLAAIALIVAGGAEGQDLLPEGFQAATQGKVFATYYADGLLQGHEAFLPGRKVIWQAVGSPCEPGHWQVENGYVCYHYDRAGPGYCLIYQNRDDGLLGTADTGEAFTLREATGADMTCMEDDSLLSRDRILPDPVRSSIFSPQIVAYLTPIPQ
jgi:hypothetical protein